MPETAEPR